MSLDLHIPAFDDGADIPLRFSRDGDDVSPALTWSNVPERTCGFALVMHDPDAPTGDFTHWVLFNIPADRRGLTEGEKGVGVEGRNDYGGYGYGGPQPPRGHGPHRYFFTLYALDEERINLEPGADRADVEAAIRGYIVAEATYMGRFERK